MIISVGNRTGDGEPMVLVGVTTQEATELLAGGTLAIDLEQQDPRLPAMRLVLCAGADDATLVANVAKAWPGIWRVDESTAAAEAEHERENGR